ncbi:PepSY domain-containing protein [Methylopila sp. 73B]|uniref:PepSY domain-containing protein n=1 Tax=Methylopila sp. 73B TaxID=1120792 RepID=UPI00037A9712|nr:PepSY domain-containing protein [Methylopila sp. 73B]
MSTVSRIALGAFALGAIALAPVSGARADETEMAKNAKVSLVQAIDAAEAKGGGKATEVEFEDDNGGRWEVKVLSAAGDKLTEYYVDPNSGQVTGEANQPIEVYFTMLKPEDFNKASTQLKAAVAAAEQLGGGKAVSAEVERESGAVAYEIDVAGADGKKDVKVDANGKATLD